MTDPITKDDFVDRFVAYMTQQAWFTHFDDGTSVDDYARDLAVICWNEPHQRECGPEECARSDMSYWGED